MSDLEDVKPTNETLFIGGRERQIKYGFSAWAKLEERYGGVKNLKQMEKDMTEKPFSTLPFLIYNGLVDKEGVTEETVLDDFTMGDVQKIAEVLTRALWGSVPQDDGTEKKMTQKKS